MSKNIVSILIIMSFVLICDVQIVGISLYVASLFFYAFIVLIRNILDGEVSATIVRIKSRESFSIVLIILLIWEIFRLIQKIFLSLSNLEQSFEEPIIFISVILLLIMGIDSVGIISYRYEILSLFCITIMLIEMIYLETGNVTVAKLVPIVKQDNIMAVNIMVFLILLGMGLENTNDRLRQLFYILLIGVGYVELILTTDWLSICILILYYLAIPIFRLPTKHLISLYMKQLFVLLFMISNMSLVTGFTDFFDKKVYLPLEASIYIDVILVVCGVIFFNYWEKVPEKVDPNRLILKRMRTGFKIASFTFSCILLAIVVGADRLIIPLDSDVAGFRLVLSIIASSMRNRGNILTNMVADGDVIGLILLILIVSMMMYKALKNISFYKPRITSLTLIACVFVVMLLTTEINANIAVIGGLVLMASAYGEEPRQKYTIRRFDYDTDIENDNRGLEEQNELSIEQN